MTTVNAQTVSRNVVVDAIYRAVRATGYINKKWKAEYFDHSQWVSLYSIKSGMEVLFPVIIKIDDGVVELRSEEGGWAFFTHRPEEGSWSEESEVEEITDVLASVLEDELTRFISRYWAKK